MNIIFEKHRSDKGKRIKRKSRISLTISVELVMLMLATEQNIAENVIDVQSFLIIIADGLIIALEP